MFTVFVSFDEQNSIQLKTVRFLSGTFTFRVQWHLWFAITITLLVHEAFSTAGAAGRLRRVPPADHRDPRQLEEALRHLPGCGTARWVLPDAPLDEPDHHDHGVLRTAPRRQRRVHEFLQPLQHGVAAAIELLRELAQGDERIAHAVAHQLLGVPARYELQEHDAERVDVGLWRHHAVLQVLRRDVPARPRDAARHREQRLLGALFAVDAGGGARDGPRGAEAPELGAGPVTGKEDAAAADVHVHPRRARVLVQVPKPLGDVQRDMHPLRPRQWRRRARGGREEAVPERAVLGVLGDEVPPAAVVAEADEADQIEVVDLPHDLHLRRHIPVHHLDGRGVAVERRAVHRPADAVLRAEVVGGRLELRVGVHLQRGLDVRHGNARERLAGGKGELAAGEARRRRRPVVACLTFLLGHFAGG
uniref:Uncharacterized protein n=1 Tax=Zea mays TaxID=4577 RepID=A0A804P1H8_MAIZE